MTEISLKDKVAIVTGAGSGIGKSIASTLASNGATVILNDINLISVKETCKIINSKYGIAESMVADVGNYKGILEMVEKIVKKHSRVDILVNNAGGAPPAAAAAARLMHLDVKQTRTALGIAASHASGVQANAGYMVSALHAGNSARGGVVAATLASMGYDANLEIRQGTGVLRDTEGLTHSHHVGVGHEAERARDRRHGGRGGDGLRGGHTD